MLTMPVSFVCILAIIGLVVAHEAKLKVPISVREMANFCEEGSEIYGSDCWCSKGYYSDNGLSPCNACDYGSYSDVIGGKLTDCKCQTGFYSLTGLSPCTACPENTESKIPIGATSCTCHPGFTGQGDDVPVDLLEANAKMYTDYYRDLHNFYSSHSFSAPCSACPVNSGTWDAYVDPLNLQESQGNKCLCDPETKSATGFGPCEPCGEGSGSPRVTISCFAVADFKSYQMTKCFCKAGYYSPDGSGSDSGGDCLMCPNGKTSNNKELVFFSGTWGTHCDGYYGFYEPLNKKCVCLRNYYKNASITFETSGHIESSDDCIQCPQGSATTDFDGTSCTICDIGYYSPNGYAPCAKCADGFTTNGYQKTFCGVTSTYTPTPVPTPIPTPSSPSITNPPVAKPTKAPVQSKKPTAYPTIRPSQASSCPQGFFSATGFSPGCQVCPLGTTNFESGSSSCDICAAGYYGVAGQTPCAACPDTYTSNERRTACYPCIGHEFGCSLNGESNVDATQQTSIDSLNTQMTQIYKTVDKFKSSVKSDITELKKAIKNKNK